MRGVRGRPIAWLKAAVGIGVLALVVVGRTEAAFAIGMAFAWLVLVEPGADANARPAFHRAVLAALTVLHSLLIYPVAGSQMRFTMVLVAMVTVVCLHDAAQAVTATWGWDEDRRRRAGMALAALPVALYLFSLSGIVRLYTASPPLGLAGSAGIRLDREDRALYRWVLGSVGKSCDSFVSFPAMHSFYLWSGKVPPVYPDVDGWQPYLNRERQAVEQRILAGPRSCVVLVDRLMPFWLRPELTAHRTLLDFIREHFVEADSRGGFHVLVRKP
jgi:hypothetical protein